MLRDVSTTRSIWRDILQYAPASFARTDSIQPLLRSRDVSGTIPSDLESFSGLEFLCTLKASRRNSKPQLPSVQDAP
eukprot:1455043-Pleurochrysis_carterae.AAC.1